LLAPATPSQRLRRPFEQDENLAIDEAVRQRRRSRHSAAAVMSKP
jgi:hypothetical protein